MKYTVVLFALLLSQFAFAEKITGSLQCTPKVVTSKNIGVLESVEMIENIGSSETSKGSELVVDLEDASEGKTLYLKRLIREPKLFDGEISFFVSLNYRRERGSINGLSVTLEHKMKRWLRKDKLFAKVSGSFPLVPGKDFTLGLNSTGGKLHLIQLSCNVSENE